MATSVYCYHTWIWCEMVTIWFAYGTFKATLNDHSKTNDYFKATIGKLISLD